MFRARRAGRGQLLSSCSGAPGGERNGAVSAGPTGRGQELLEVAEASVDLHLERNPNCVDDEVSTKSHASSSLPDDGHTRRDAAHDSRVSCSHATEGTDGKKEYQWRRIRS